MNDTPEELKTRITDLRKKLSIASSNLSELIEQPFINSLKGDLANKKLTGTSKTSSQKLISNIESLWEMVMIFGNSLNEADIMLQTPPLFGRAEHYISVRDFLRNKSIKVKVKTKSLMERDLMDEAEVYEEYTFDKYIQMMKSLYDEIVNNVKDLELSMKGLKAKYNELVKRVQNIPRKYIGNLEVKLSEVQSIIETDPIESAKLIRHEIIPLIDIAEETKIKEENALKELTTKYSQCFNNLNWIKGEYSRIQTIVTMRKPSIIEMDDILKGDISSKIDELDKWLKSIKDVFDKGNLFATEHGLNNWNKKIEKVSGIIQDILSKVHNLESERNDIMGLFGALITKRKSLENMGKLTERIKDMEVILTQVLFCESASIVEIRRHLNDYQQSLRS